MSEEGHKEMLARLKAEADQTRESMSDLAVNLAAFFRSCQDNGFDRKESLALTRTFLTSGLNQTRGEDA